MLRDESLLNVQLDKLVPSPPAPSELMERNDSGQDRTTAIGHACSAILRQKLVVAACIMLLPIAASGCGNEQETAVSTAAPNAQPAGAVSRPVEPAPAGVSQVESQFSLLDVQTAAKEWSGAWAGLPIFGEFTGAALPLDSLLRGADVWVLATVDRVSDLKVVDVASQVVACESAEGVPTGDQCEVTTAVAMTDLSLLVDVHLKGSDGTPRERLVVPVSLATAYEPEGAFLRDVGDPALEMFRKATPVGFQVVAGLTTNAGGRALSALALIGPDGQIVPLDLWEPGDARPVGLGELSDVDALVERLRS